MKRFSTVALLFVALSVLASACGGDSDDAADSEPSPSDTIAETFAFGEPGDDGSVDRTIAVTQSDAMTFDPASLDVQAGETVRFDVTNAGQAPHEFVLGDRALQEEHEHEMGSMGGTMTSDEPYAIAVDPGQTKSVVWTFTVGGSFEYACHVPGHYAAGMRGAITVA